MVHGERAKILAVHKKFRTGMGKAPPPRRKTIIKNDGGGKKVSGKKPTTTQAVKAKGKPPTRRSKYKGVAWHGSGKWRASFCVNGKSKSLGLCHDEKEAARVYDEQAALHGKPVNFPLHEGQEQAMKKQVKRRE